MSCATLVLQDGTVLHGTALGAPTDAVFELVFNTSMTGYQEILSDPSYRGQGVLFTCSHIGNVGINLEDNEALVPQASATVIRSLSSVVSNWRASRSLSDWLAEYHLPGISDVDTRFLTRKLRDQGTMKAALSTCGRSVEELKAMVQGWPGLDGRDTVGEVTCPTPFHWVADNGSKWVPRRRKSTAARLALFDFGAKRNIMRHLSAWGADVTVFPAYASFEELMAFNPDGVMLSNGPGDPAGLPSIVAMVRQLLDSGLPVFGICLGHQLIGRALGGETRRLKFGHHSGNHPVKDLRSGKVLVTAQNHNYAVEPTTLNLDEVELTHISLNDNTLEGLRLKNRPVFSVQFHPEGAPGPHDAHDLFGEFFMLVEQHLATKEKNHACS